MQASVYKIGDDAQVTLGHLELQLAFTQDHLENLRLSLFYVSKLYGFLKHRVPESPDRNKDLKTLLDLHTEMCNMQRNISIGTGMKREQWKDNLAKLSEIQMQAGQIAIKYDMVRYEISQFSEFK